MITVKQLLSKKGHDYFFVKPETNTYEAIQKMSEKDVGALMVIDNDKLVGIFSERDYARKCAQSCESPCNMQVKDLMITQVMTVDQGKTILAYRIYSDPGFLIPEFICKNLRCDAVDVMKSIKKEAENN